jgi:hypothetical protein
MPIKRKERLVNSAPSSTGTKYSNWVSTDNYKDLIFVLRMGASDFGGGSSSDTVNAWIEASSTDDPTQHASNIRALNLTKPSDNSVVQAFEEVGGDDTLPSDTKTATPLRQQLDYKSPNVDEYVRVAYTIAGTPANLGTIVIDMYANKEE